MSVSRKQSRRSKKNCAPVPLITKAESGGSASPTKASNTQVPRDERIEAIYRVGRSSGPRLELFALCSHEDLVSPELAGAMLSLAYDALGLRLKSPAPEAGWQETANKLAEILEDESLPYGVRSILTDAVFEVSNTFGLGGSVADILKGDFSVACARAAEREGRRPNDKPTE